jgi:hypothetical protein
MNLKEKASTVCHSLEIKVLDDCMLHSPYMDLKLTFSLLLETTSAWSALGRGLTGLSFCNGGGGLGTKNVAYVHSEFQHPQPVKVVVQSYPISQQSCERGKKTQRMYF